MNDWMDLDEDPGHYVREGRRAPLADPRPINDLAENQYVEICKKCNGSGRWFGERQCFACKGQGKLVRKTSPEARAKASDRYQETKAQKAEDRRQRIIAWQEEHRDEADWITTSAQNGFEFAVSIREALYKYGFLTEKQMATVQRLALQYKERRAEKHRREATAPLIRMDKIEEAFATARASGKTFGLKLSLDTFVFSPASARGVNAGAIYVKENEIYLGKICQGKFIASRDCSEFTSARILKVAFDPKSAAIAYGKRTGNCACCGRLLTNEGSIDLGIGPICAGKWGW